jgi:hypothetical protein
MVPCDCPGRFQKQNEGNLNITSLPDVISLWDERMFGPDLSFISHKQSDANFVVIIQGAGLSAPLQKQFNYR